MKTPQDFDTLNKGFTKLRDKYRTTTSALEHQLRIREDEIEKLTTQIATLHEELKVQAETAENQVSALHIVCIAVVYDDSPPLTVYVLTGGEWCNRFFHDRPRRFPQYSGGVKCPVCYDVYSDPHRYLFPCVFSFQLRLNPCSLDCRHVFCGLCIASWFATGRDNTCPECRATCHGYPQRDYALRNVLPKVYAALEPKQDRPDNSSIFPPLFAHVYQMLAAYKANEVPPGDEELFWAPLIAEVEKLRGVPGSSSAVDEDFEMDNSQDPDFEPGSDAGLGEDEDEDGTDVEQYEAAQDGDETGPV